MSIKSLFFPDYALQGQKIPAHIIWELMEYNKIKVEFSGPIEIEDIFNAKKARLSQRGIVEVERVGSEGYLGLLFASKRAARHNAKCKIAFSFVDTKGKIILREERSGLLFRPNLVAKEIPHEINVDPVKKFVNPRIKMRNSGEGTILVQFATRKESEIEKEIAHDYKKYLSNVHDDLKASLPKLAESFPEYSRVINRYLSYLDNYGREWWDSTSFLEFRRFVYDMGTTIFRNQEFFELFIEALGEAILGNVHLLTIPESFMLYLSSIAARKIFVLHPEEIINVSKSPKTLHLEILPTDLLLNEYPPIELPPIKVVAQEEGTVEVCRLFDWGSLK